MRKIKALIYLMLGGMVAWGYAQRGDTAMAIFIAAFSIAIAAVAASPIGRMRISWNDAGITLAVFPKKPRNIAWSDLEKVSLDHLGYHIKARTGQFKIRKAVMPEDLLKRIKQHLKENKESAPTD